MPNSAAQKAGTFSYLTNHQPNKTIGLLLHHTLGNGDFTVYERMSRAISETTVILNDPHTAAQEIDRVLRICYIRARPVYIGVPTDIAFEKIPAVPLKKPLDLSLHPNDAKTEAEVVAEIKEHLYKAKNPIILADACTIRHRVVNEVRELMDKTNLPTFVSPMGKSAVDETHKAFGGVYAGDVSREDVKKRVEGADLVLYVGGLKSDFNSGGFTYRITRDKTIEFHSDHMKVLDNCI